MKTSDSGLSSKNNNSLFDSEYSKQTNKNLVMVTVKYLIVPKLTNDPNDLLSEGWIETTHPQQKKGSHSRVFHNNMYKLDIRYDKGEPGATGFRGKDHYHIKNPFATSKTDEYLDKDGNPTPKGSKDSHILPQED